ncbi:hypothetical protein C1H46_007093 [Malus baccata]|uniref:Uncharacterized protein n=1 Tax=Malus baccata TaxID=106549 RepID=A0A540N8A4_MALBA|nr:hypothetical protein C1H46_007093 [Malus baccata]
MKPSSSSAVDVNRFCGSATAVTSGVEDNVFQYPKGNKDEGWVGKWVEGWSRRWRRKGGCMTS